jgi:hypothetical protein
MREVNGPSEQQPDGHERRAWARLLLLLPFVATLAVPYYNTIDPTIDGMPFFYWYQLLWVGLDIVIIGIVYFLERENIVPDEGMDERHCRN